MKLQLLTLAIDIFKLSTSKSFIQKGFTQVEEIQVSLDVGTYGILILGSSVLGS